MLHQNQVRNSKAIHEEKVPLSWERAQFWDCCYPYLDGDIDDGGKLLCRVKRQTLGNKLVLSTSNSLEQTKHCRKKGDHNNPSRTALMPEKFHSAEIMSDTELI